MRLWPFALSLAFALAILQACDKRRHDDSSSAVDASTASSAAFDAEGEGSATAKAAGGKRLVLQLAAASFVASVSDVPEWPESDAGAKRLGYLRNGAVVSAYDPPIRNEDCKDGWYELVGGGYVCGKVATIDLTNPRVKRAPKQPDRDAGMPYRYGVNVSDGTPLYRRVLSAEDRRRYEPVHAAPKATEEDASAATDGEKSEKEEEPTAAAVAVEEEPSAPRRHSNSKDRRERDKDRDRNRDPFKNTDAGRPLLKELKGRGVLVRRMARGFTIALDRDFKAAGAHWWRTTFGFAVPYERIALQGGVAKHVGNWFIGEVEGADVLPFPNLSSVGSTSEPEGGAGEAGFDGGSGVARAESDAGVSLVGTVAFVSVNGAHKFEVADNGKGGSKVGWGGELPKRSAVLLTGREVAIAGVTYHQTSAGFWVRLAELRTAKPEIPADVGSDERWIDVDLTRQQLVAFEGRRPVFATLVSSGRGGPHDPEHDFRTPPGSYRIREKHVTTTMDGDVASDGPYSIEDVPWVMYFQGSYALHGAFWHDSFGNTRSHGCVNLSPEDARTLFGWTLPSLPPGWHGVFSRDESSGSRVIVHEDPPPGKRRSAAVVVPR